ncbi:MAG: lipid-A-disaccharide synthase [Roseobacter sp.]
MIRVFILAGEPSGDKLGGALMAGLRELHPDIAFEGVGGVQMEAQGLASQFPMSELSVMGIAEVLPKYRALKRRIRQTADHVIRSKPDLLITIDSPDFSLRVAKRVKAACDVRTVHYVAPTVWAWRPKRVQKIANCVDHLLALFPFEPAYFTPHGIDCDFVGHPVVNEPLATDQDAAAFRQAHDIGDAPLLMVLPGSRQGEVSRLAPVFGDTVGQLMARRPNLRVVVPVAAPVAETVKAAVQDWPGQPIVLDPRGWNLDQANQRKRTAFKAADVALAASGTVSLELAAARTPMVIAYKMHWLSFRIIKAMALVDTVTLVNLVSDTRVVPEYLGPSCISDDIAKGLAQVLDRPEDQIDAMNTTMDRLGEGGEAPGLRAARAVLTRM